MTLSAAGTGTSWEPNLAVLRDFRDEHLLTNGPGRAFVDFYYRIAPPIAEWINEREWAKALTRMLMTPGVLAIRHMLFSFFIM